jgi:hypothetical protein
VSPEQVGVPHVGLQHVHRLVKRHVPHLEHRSAAARGAGQEAGPQGMGAEVRYPTGPMPAPLLPTDGDAVPPTFEVNGRQYPDTAILRNSFSAPAFRAPALSTPAGLTSEGLPAGLELDGLPGEDNQLLSLGMAIEAVLGPLPPPTFRNG